MFERYRFHEIISCCKHIPCTGTTKCILVLYLFISLVNLIFACLVPSNYVFSTHFETYKTEITRSIGFVLLDKFEKKTGGITKFRLRTKNTQIRTLFPLKKSFRESETIFFVVSVIPLYLSAYL